MIDVRSISKSYRVGKGVLQAVRNVSFRIQQGEILGVVGESGSGKSTLGRMLVRLEEPTSGEILFQGLPLQKARRNQIQMIFQDPYSSLNPRMTVEDLVHEPCLIHKLPNRVDELLDLVGLPKNAKHRFPHEFSGGQRQRIGIARALSLRPEFIVCDEPISALDVSIQAQIISLLQNLQQEFKLTYLFIAHDLAVVRYISTRVAVMYCGEFVEVAPSEILFGRPLHPYTQLLLSSVPLHNPIEERKRMALPILGEPPSPLAQIKGCPFASRCPKAMPICREEAPKLAQVTEEHAVACHLVNAKKEALPLFHLTKSAVY